MIGLLIQDNAYEQDIRELLMSFYPGEVYAHEVKDGVSFYVETRLGAGEVMLLIWERPGQADPAAGGEKPGGADPADSGEMPGGTILCPPSGMAGWRCADLACGKTDLSDLTETKNVVKKLFYQMLIKRTGRTLPWGSLTGIRPTKIALSRLMEGWKEEDIRSFMKKTYMASDETINLCIEIGAREKALLEI